MGELGLCKVLHSYNRVHRGTTGCRRGVGRVRGLYAVGLLENLVQIARAIVPLNQSFTVPLEVLQQDSGRVAWNLGVGGGLVSLRDQSVGCG